MTAVELLGSGSGGKGEGFVEDGIGSGGPRAEVLRLSRPSTAVDIFKACSEREVIGAAVLTTNPF